VTLFFLGQQESAVLLLRTRAEEDATLVTVRDGYAEEFRVELQHDLRIAHEESDVTQPGDLRHW